MNNLDLRSLAKSYGVRLWQIAELKGICDTALSKKLRKELPKEEKETLIEIIKNIGRKEHDNGHS